MTELTGHFFKIWDKLVLHWHHIIDPHWFQCTVFCRFLLIAWQRNCDILISDTGGYVIIDVDGDDRDDDRVWCRFFCFCACLYINGDRIVVFWLRTLIFGMLRPKTLIHTQYYLWKPGSYCVTLTWPWNDLDMPYLVKLCLLGQFCLYF